MGGAGSGYWYRWGAKETAESKKSIDIRWMKKQGVLVFGTSGSFVWSSRGEETSSVGYQLESDRLVLNYKNRQNGGGWESIEDEIQLTSTSCNYGGERKWFRCPGCYRRVAVIYGGKYFRCRHCHDLVYSSQQESKPYRLIRKVRKIRERLEASDNLSESILFKPKNMHRETFDRLRREADQAHNLSFILTAQQVGMNAEDFKPFL